MTVSQSPISKGNCKINFKDKFVIQTKSQCGYIHKHDFVPVQYVMLFLRQSSPLVLERIQRRNSPKDQCRGAQALVLFLDTHKCVPFGVDLSD